MPATLFHSSSSAFSSLFQELLSWCCTIGCWPRPSPSSIPRTPHPPSARQFRNYNNNIEHTVHIRLHQLVQHWSLREERRAEEHTAIPLPKVRHFLTASLFLIDLRSCISQLLPLICICAVGRPIGSLNLIAPVLTSSSHLGSFLCSTQLCSAS